MRIGRLIALAALVLGLGAYILFVERHKPTTDELKEREGKVFAGFDQAKAWRVVVINSHGRFELAKDKDTWNLTAPIADQANQGSVSSLLFALAGLKSERTLAAKDVKLSEFGLDKPALSVTVSGEGGTSYTLKLGGELPLGNQRAALVGGNDVYLVNKYIASDIDKDLAGWRSDQLAQVYSGDVASLFVTSPAGQVALAHTGALWTITAPTPDLADRDRAEGVIGDISGARIKEFVDTAPDLAALGLQPPRETVTIARRGADAAPVVLAFGNERDAKDGRQVACKRGEGVFWVEAKTAARLAGPWQEWRSKKLVQLDTWAANKVEVESGTSKAALESKDGIWKAGATEVDADAVSSRLAALAELTVRQFDRPKPAGAAAGKIKVSGEGFTVEASFYPGASPGEAIAVVVGRTGGLSVDGAKVKELLADPAALAKPKPTPTAPPVPTPAGKNKK